MRQLTPASNLVLSVLAGLGLLGTLSLPWFAAPAVSANSMDGPVERGAFQVSHFFGTDAAGMVDGGDALGGAKATLYVLIGVVALVGAAVAVPALRRGAEDLLRLVALAGPIVVIILAVAHPGTTTPVHVHYGFAVAFLASALMASAAWHGSSMRQAQVRRPGSIRISAR